MKYPLLRGKLAFLAYWFIPPFAAATLIACVLPNCIQNAFSLKCAVWGEVVLALKGLPGGRVQTGILSPNDEPCFVGSTSGRWELRRSVPTGAHQRKASAESPVDDMFIMDSYAGSCVVLKSIMLRFHLHPHLNLQWFSCFMVVFVICRDSSPEARNLQVHGGHENAWMQLSGCSLVR